MSAGGRECDRGEGGDAPLLELPRVVLERYDDLECSPEDVDQWDPIESGFYYTGKSEAVDLRGAIDTPHAAIEVEFDDFDACSASVSYQEEGVNVEAIGDGINGVKLSALVKMDADAAREIAAALWQAAWEYDHREIEATGDGEGSA